MAFDATDAGNSGRPPGTCGVVDCAGGPRSLRRPCRAAVSARGSDRQAAGPPGTGPDASRPAPPTVCSCPPQCDHVRRDAARRLLANRRSGRPAAPTSGRRRSASAATSRRDGGNAAAVRETVATYVCPSGIVAAGGKADYGGISGSWIISAGVPFLGAAGLASGILVADDGTHRQPPPRRCAGGLRRRPRHLSRRLDGSGGAGGALHPPRRRSRRLAARRVTQRPHRPATGGRAVRPSGRRIARIVLVALSAKGYLQ